MATDSKTAASGLPILDRIDQRVIQDLALGTEPDAEILGRYGFTSEQAEAILADPFVKEQVANLVTELRRQGGMAKIKARLAAENLIPDIYRKAKHSNSLADLLDAFKALSKVGDLEPRNDSGGKVTGTIVRVDLNIGQLGFGPAAHAQKAVTVEAEVVEVREKIEGSISAHMLGIELDALEWVES